MHERNKKGLIFDIQGHSIHDGPGTRTLVFLSGCPLRCKWCSNPEGLLLRRRLMYNSRLCRNCPARCVSACAAGAVKTVAADRGLVEFERSLCDRCDTMQCIDACYGGALQTSGKWYTVDELMSIFRRDRNYWGAQGGVTLTGGEPLMQQAFVVDLLERCHEAYIDTCVETCAHVPRVVLQAVLPHLQWLFIDIKHMNAAKHRECTGVSNEQILDNIRWVKSANWIGHLVLRMPVVPGFNDGLDNAQSTATFLSEIGQNEIHLLPFHCLGSSKYEKLGLPYDYAEQATTPPESLQFLAEVYRQRGMTCYVGADTPF